MQHHTDITTPVPSNMATVIGTVDTHIRKGRQVILVERRNPAGGLEHRLRIQVRSPFGHSFAMQVIVENHAHALEQLAGAGAGSWIRASGTIEWPPVLSHIQASTLARQAMEELLLRAHTVEVIPAQASTSSSLSFQGRVVAPPRITRHPYRKNIVLAATSLETSIAASEAYAAGSRRDIKRVPIVIALQHPDTANILRDSNIVAVAGTLERVVFARSSHDTATALAAFDAAWSTRIELMGPRERAIAERQYEHRRYQVGHIDLARCVIDHAELLSGTPANSHEARQLRDLHIRRRRKNKEKRASTGDAAAIE